MAMTLYATPDQFADWLAVDVPANGTALLRSATLLVAKAINESPYDPAIVIDQPRIDATCAQAASWALAGIDPSAGIAGLGGTVKSKGVDGATITYDVVAAVDRAAVISTLCSDAYDILYAAQLIWTPLPVWQAFPDAGVYVDEIDRLGGLRLPPGVFVGDGFEQ